MTELDLPIADARVVAPKYPEGLIGDLTQMLDQACDDLNIEITPAEYDNDESCSVGLAAWLVVMGLFPALPVERWVSLIVPGDVLVDEQRVVIATRSRISRREGTGVEIVSATPTATTSLERAEWPDAHVTVYEDPYEKVRVIVNVWPNPR